MKYSHNLFLQLRSIKLIILVILAASAALFGIVLVLHFQTGIPLGHLTRDPVSILEEGSPYTGFLSQVGILFWSASVTVSLFTAHVLTHSSNTLQLQKFFFRSGLISLLLGIDDVFLLHEGLSHLFGISEMYIFACYSGLTLLWLVMFHKIILRTEYLLLGIALVFFGLSIIIDLMKPDIIFRVLLEDGAKLIGILTWMAYFFRCGSFAICRHPCD